MYPRKGSLTPRETRKAVQRATQNSLYLITNATNSLDVRNVSDELITQSVNGESSDTSSSPSDISFDQNDSVSDNTSTQNCSLLYASSPLPRSDSEDLEVQANVIDSEIDDDSLDLDVEVDMAVTFKKDLVTWAIKHKVHHNTIKSLLIVLKKHPCHAGLPNDPRTLLATPRFTVTRNVYPGTYHHFGIYIGITNIIAGLESSTIGTLVLPQAIKLSINVDGLPLAKSSGSALWPIQGLVAEISSTPFLIGAYSGNEKPSSANDFLKDFVEEAIELTTNGISVQHNIIPFELVSVICDAPAKSFICLTKGHTGFYSCTKCDQKGAYKESRVCFPHTNPLSTLRSDDSFSRQVQKEYHMGHSLLDTVPNFGMVSKIPLDYMHLACLGAMKKLILIWMRGKLPSRMSNHMVERVSTKLAGLKCQIPVDFARKPRALTHVDRWKATEFRQILLYTGPIVFKHILPLAAYKNFMMLNTAIRILASVNLCQVYNDYANRLLNSFVKGFGRLYGTSLISHNIHGLMHLAQDVGTFGPVDTFSAFPFENFMQELKKLLRKSEKPLAQLDRRYKEIKRNYLQPSKNLGVNSSFSECHTDGPLLANCTDPQYKTITRLGRHNFMLSCKDMANNCVMMRSEEVVVVENIAFSKPLRSYVIIGRAFRDLNNFFEYPLPSSQLGIHRVQNLSHLKCWAVDEITNKLVKLKSGHSEVVFPLLHH